MYIAIYPFFLFFFYFLFIFQCIGLCFTSSPMPIFKIVSFMVFSYFPFPKETYLFFLNSISSLITPICLFHSVFLFSANSYSHKYVLVSSTLHAFSIFYSLPCPVTLLSNLTWIQLLLSNKIVHWYIFGFFVDRLMSTNLLWMLNWIKAIAYEIGGVARRLRLYNPDKR